MFNFKYKTMTRAQFLGISYLVVRRFPELRFIDIFLSITNGIKRYHILWKKDTDEQFYVQNVKYFDQLGLTLAGDHAFGVVSDAPETEQYQVVHKFEEKTDTILHLFDDFRNALKKEVS